MRADIFYFTVTKNAKPTEVAIIVEVDETATVAEMVAAATEASGIKLASRGDKGAVQIQSDKGIYTRGGKALVRRDGTEYEGIEFKSWDELDAEV